MTWMPVDEEREPAFSSKDKEEHFKKKFSGFRQDILLTDTAYRILDKIRSHSPYFMSGVGTSNVFISLTRMAYFNNMVMSLSRIMIDRNSSGYTLLKFWKDAEPFVRKEVVKKIREDLPTYHEVNTAFGDLKLLRDCSIAHREKGYFIDPENFSEKAISYRQLMNCREMTVKYYRTLSLNLFWFDGPPADHRYWDVKYDPDLIMYPIPDPTDTDKILELIISQHFAIKYYEERGHDEFKRFIQREVAKEDPEGFFEQLNRYRKSIFDLPELRMEDFIDD